MSPVTTVLGISFWKGTQGFGLAWFALLGVRQGIISVLKKS